MTSSRPADSQLERSGQAGVCAFVPLDQVGFHPRVFGMGVLVSPKEVITAAHVITKALALTPGATPFDIAWRVCFPFDAGHFIDGIIDPNRWFQADNEKALSDIAIVVLNDEAPSRAGLAILKKHKSGWTARAFGFRSDGEVSHPSGEWSEGTIIGPQPLGRVQLEGTNFSGAAVERGFSGSGVYVQRFDCVVGMVVQKDKAPDKRITQFIDVPTLQTALGKGTPRRPSAEAKKERVPRSLKAISERMQDIEEYLKSVGTSLGRFESASELGTVLDGLLGKATKDSIRLRTAFGLPRDTRIAGNLLALVLSGEPSMNPVKGVLSQRLHHLLWRYEFTLTEIDAKWAKVSKARSENVRRLCSENLLWKQPTLLDLIGAPSLEERLQRISEPGPDAALYGALRAIDHADHNRLPLAQSELERTRFNTMSYIVQWLDAIHRSGRVEDSSNAWWAVRTGIKEGDKRYDDLLAKVANRFNDVRIAPEETRLVAVPEIYKPVRTTAYTLSNVQAILERRSDLDGSLKGKLEGIMGAMVERLMAAPSSRQIYLASVHHEGLRNYRDHVGSAEETT